MKAALVLTVVLAFDAHALPARIAVHPLEVAGVDRDDAQKLEAAFDVKLARLTSVRLAGSARVSEALALSGAACSQRDACLRRLAEHTDSLYALSAVLMADALRTELRVSARVIRVDGAVVRAVERTAALASPGDTVKVGRELLDQLIGGLELGLLRETVPLTVEPALATGVTALEAAPTPSLPPRAVIGSGLMGVGAATLGAGAVLAALAGTGHQQLHVDARGNVPAAEADAAARVAHEAQAATVLLPLGVLVAAGGLLLALLPSSSTQVTAAVSPGCAQLAVRGAFP